MSGNEFITAEDIKLSLADTVWRCRTLLIAPFQGINVFLRNDCIQHDYQWHLFCKTTIISPLSSFSAAQFARLWQQEVFHRFRDFPDTRSLLFDVKLL